MLTFLVVLLAACAAADYPAPAPQYGIPVAPTYAPPAPPQYVPQLVSQTQDGRQTAVEFGDQGLHVVTGDEAFLYPEEQISASPLFARLGLAAALLPLPKLFLKLFSPFGLVLSGLALLVLLGGALTTAVCAFTPICSISFLGRVTSMRSLPDRLTQTTAYVLDAIDSYKDFSEKVSRKERALREKKWGD